MPDNERFDDIRKTKARKLLHFIKAFSYFITYMISGVTAVFLGRPRSMQALIPALTFIAAGDMYSFMTILESAERADRRRRPSTLPRKDYQSWSRIHGYLLLLFFSMTIIGIILDDEYDRGFS